MLRLALCTLGCKLNQFETAYMAHLCEGIGYRVVSFPSGADLYIVNTCTVTAKSEQHSRNAVRKAIRANPSGTVIVTGCAAQVNPEAFAAIPGVGLILGNREKERFLSYLAGVGKDGGPMIHVTNWDSHRAPLFPMAINRFVDYTRAFVKVQEGCNEHCTYCVVPLARGPARSAAMGDILAQAKKLWDAGYREIVLTGIHLGQYGKDMHPRRCLAELLEGILAGCGSNRVRLSSIEPIEFTPALLSIMGSDRRLCPHFHVPLQSGSGEVLMRMGRRYTPEEYEAVIQGILHTSPFASIGADVMVGFPGEREGDFEKTCRLVERLPLAYIHVFSYSPRPCTPAAGFEGQVDPLVKRERSQHLRILGQRKKEAFRSRFLGEALEALVLNQPAPRKGYRVALTGNYIPVFIQADAGLVNHLVIVKLLRVTGDGVGGEISSVVC